jgi:hypothetical protein
LKKEDLMQSVLYVQIKRCQEIFNKIFADYEFYKDYNDDLSSISKTIDYTMTKVKNTDPLLITKELMTETANNLSYIADNVDAFYSSSNVSYLTTAGAYTHSLLSCLPKFIYPTTSREMAGYKLAEENYKELLDEYIDMLENKHEALNKSVTEVAATIEIERNDLETLFSEFKKKLSDEHAELITEWNEIFEKRDQTFLDKNDAIIKEWQQKYNENFEKFNSTKEEIERVAGSLSTHAMAYSFKKIADDEKESKRKWNITTIVGFIALIAYGIVFFISSFYTEFSWPDSFRGLTLALSIGALITYSARQVSIHGKVERYCRKMEIELASLGPYFAEYKDRGDKVLDTRIDLANRFFGKGDIITAAVQSNDSKESLPVISDLIDVMKELVKKSN